MNSFTDAEIINAKAEIERLQRLGASAARKAVDERKKLLDAKAEIERLETEYESVYEQVKADILGNMADGGISCHWCIEQHKAEAIKELMFNLDEEISTYSSNGKDLNVYAWLKNYVKEMVGE